MTCCGIEVGESEWCPICRRDLRTPPQVKVAEPERPANALQRFVRVWNRLVVRPAIVTERDGERGVGLEIRKDL